MIQLSSANSFWKVPKGDDGRNVVRYVPASEMQAIQEAIEGYHLFITLAEQYADEVIRLTRSQREKKNSPGKTKSRYYRSLHD